MYVILEMAKHWILLCMSDTVKTDLNLFRVFITGFLQLRLLEVVHKVSVNLSLCMSWMQILRRRGGGRRIAPLLPLSALDGANIPGGQSSRSHLNKSLGWPRSRYERFAEGSITPPGNRTTSPRRPSVYRSHCTGRAEPAFNIYSYCSQSKVF